jgi:hypothetical protein
MAEPITKQDSPWLQAVWRIARKEVAVFEGNNIGYTEDLIKNNARRHMMVWFYAYLVSSKKAPPIEDLDLEVKKEMWAFVKEICAGKTKDSKRMKEIAKVFYLIEYFINEPLNSTT